jgi:hypothetical protein
LKYIRNFIDLILSTIGILGSTYTSQSFPDINKALSKINLSNYESQIYAKTGLHSNEIELIPKNNQKDNSKKSNQYFTAYTSNVLQKSFNTTNNQLPKDECIIVFNAYNKNSKDCSIEPLSFEVIFTRLKNGSLTNTWEFKNTNINLTK